MLSLYLHIPFCMKKCPYCDFYSLPAESGAMDAYAAALQERLRDWGERLSRPKVHTVYFGGGTPSRFGAARLRIVLEAARSSFEIVPEAEITAEANPADVTADFARALCAAGVNRVSLGVQSGNDGELSVLGRRHTARGAAEAVGRLREAGVRNLSLDLMLGLPGSGADTLQRSLEFLTSLSPEHISAYLLKIEPGTPFAARAETLALPEDDDAAEQYLLAVRFLAAHGYAQYEISNFARPGFESRHNLQYWRSGEYLGLGPSAHSFLSGRRFFFPRSLASFLQGNAPQDDGAGGDFSEYAMLALRLSEGLSRDSCAARFPEGEARFSDLLRRAETLPARLLRRSPERVSLTPEGFLVSNAVLAALLP